MNGCDNETMLVTVVTASYKKLDYIYMTIDSVLQQDYARIEYIITDDGSENFHKEEIEQYIQMYANTNLEKCVVIHHENNEGTVKNLNHAYEMAKGELIFCLSADDQFYDNTIITKIVDRYLDLNFDVLSTKVILCEDDLTPIDFFPRKEYDKYILGWKDGHTQFMKHVIGMDFCMASGCALTITKDIYMRLGGFDERYCLYEDGPFIAKYLASGGVVYFAYDIISRFYRTGGVSMGTSSEIMLKDIEAYHNEFLLDGKNAKDIHEKNKLLFWNKIFRAETIYEKIFISLGHPVYFSEYLLYTIRKLLPSLKKR